MVKSESMKRKSLQGSSYSYQMVSVEGLYQMAHENRIIFDRL